MWPKLEEVSIFIRPGVTDMRKQINGLVPMVETVMEKEPFSGALFLFCGKSRTLLKAVYWDRNGFCLWQKRLEEGRFPWPEGEEAVKELTQEELSMILSGIDFRNRFRRIEYRHVG